MWEEANVFRFGIDFKEGFYEILCPFTEDPGKQKEMLKIFRSTYIIRFSLEAFRSLLSEGIYYLQLQVSKVSSVSVTETSVSNFSKSYARKKKCPVCLSGNLKNSQGILFLLRTGVEEKNTRRELVAKSCPLQSLHFFSSEWNKNIIVIIIIVTVKILIT